jgi:Contractile injection system tube protein
MSFAGSLAKMTITACKDEELSGTECTSFTVLINPAAYSHSYKICYNNRQAQGSSAGSPDFDRIPSETVKFELVFDGTGVVPSSLPGVEPFTGDGVKEQIGTFKRLVFTYDGSIHSPNYVQLAWGSFLFNCRLSSLDLNYTLFKPDGTPLRARATVNFVGFTSEKKLARQANNSSPDLSHVVTVKGGDTLPLLCYDIYGSSAYYLEVARVNKLENFRNLVTGTQLLFPPLQNATT